MSPQDSVIVQAKVSRQNRDKLVEILRGYPDIFSELQIANPPEPPYPDKSIFINYRRDDSEDVCGRIYDRLALEFGKGSVFKDVDDIPPGVDFRQILEREVSSCDLMVVVIGENWDNRTNRGRLNDANDYVRFEIETALKRGIPVIPVLVQRRAKLPDKGSLPKSLQDLLFRNAREARPDPDFHKDMDRIIQGIKEVFDSQPVVPIIPMD
jgi:hypothetical protein